jgi:hypothetical protein
MRMSLEGHKPAPARTAQLGQEPPLVVSFSGFRKRPFEVPAHFGQKRSLQGRRENLCKRAVAQNPLPFRRVRPSRCTATNIQPLFSSSRSE